MTRALTVIFNVCDVREANQTRIFYHVDYKCQFTDVPVASCNNSPDKALSLQVVIPVGESYGKSRSRVKRYADAPDVALRSYARDGTDRRHQVCHLHTNHNIVKI